MKASQRTGAKLEARNPNSKSLAVVPSETVALWDRARAAGDASAKAGGRDKWNDEDLAAAQAVVEAAR